jgi:hypothetical protein
MKKQNKKSSSQVLGDKWNMVDSYKNQHSTYKTFDKQKKQLFRIVTNTYLQGTSNTGWCHHQISKQLSCQSPPGQSRTQRVWIIGLMNKKCGGSGGIRL